jgi:activator of 2-hydroxyglutaryl-CoA dehydratase
MIVNKENRYNEAWKVSTLTGQDSEIENVYYRAVHISPEDVESTWASLEANRQRMDKYIRMYAEVIRVGVDVGSVHLNTCNDHIIIAPDGTINGKYHGYAFNSPKDWTKAHEELMREIKDKGDDNFSRNPKVNEIIGGEMRCTGRPVSCGCPECVESRSQQ